MITQTSTFWDLINKRQLRKAQTPPRRLRLAPLHLLIGQTWGALVFQRNKEDVDMGQIVSILHRWITEANAALRRNRFGTSAPHEDTVNEALESRFDPAGAHSHSFASRLEAIHAKLVGIRNRGKSERLSGGLRATGTCPGVPTEPQVKLLHFLELKNSHLLLTSSYGMTGVNPVCAKAYFILLLRGGKGLSSSCVHISNA